MRDVAKIGILPERSFSNASGRNEYAGIVLHTTKIRPTSFAVVKRRVYFSLRYVAPLPFCRSSIKTSLIRLLINVLDIGA